MYVLYNILFMTCVIFRIFQRIFKSVLFFINKYYFRFQSNLYFKKNFNFERY